MATAALYLYVAPDQCRAINRVVNDPEVVIAADPSVRAAIEDYVRDERIGQCVGVDEEFSALLQAGIILAKEGDLTLYRRVVASDVAGGRLDELASAVAAEYNSGQKVATQLLVAIPSSHVIPMDEFEVERLLAPDASLDFVAATIAGFSREQLRSRRDVFEPLLHRPVANDRVKEALRSVLADEVETEGGEQTGEGAS